MADDGDNIERGLDPPAGVAAEDHAEAEPVTPVEPTVPAAAPAKTGAPEVQKPQTVNVDLDLSKDESVTAILSPSPPATKSYNVNDLLEDQETARATIAYILLVMLGVVIVLAFVLLWAKPYHSEKLVQLLQIVFGPIVAPVGAATGYYFGAASANTTKKDS